jgi:hypothetical protein
MPHLDVVPEELVVTVLNLRMYHVINGDTEED